MANEKISNYFKDYPASSQCFETADGLLFHEKGDANLHQQGTLKLKEPVQQHYRPFAAEAAAPVAEDALIGDEEGAKKPKSGKK